MITNYENIVKQSEIKELLDFTFINDNYYDESPTNVRKEVALDATDWPVVTINKIISRLNLDHELEYVFFWHHKTTNFGLHADCGDGNHKLLGKNIIIPLDFDKDTPTTTVIFKNKWHGSAVNFYKGGHHPYEDSSKCEGYDINKNIDEKIYQKYLKHIDRKTLKGLEIQKIYNWKLGDVFTFDRQHIHSPGYTYAPKTSMIIFTNRKGYQ